MPPMQPSQIIVFIIGTVIILFGAYYVTYYVGMKASGRSRAGGIRNRNINVLDRFATSRDKSYEIVEIAGKVYIVGITNNSMTVLDTYDAGQFAELTESTQRSVQMPWANTPVGRYGNKLTKKVVQYFGRKSGKIPPEDPENNTGFADSMREAEKNYKPGGDE